MKTLLKLFYLVPVLVTVGVCGYLMSNRSKIPSLHVMSGRPFVSTAITNLTANFFTSGGHLDPAGNDVFIEFRDAGGKPVAVGDVGLALGLDMPQAVMHNISKGLPTGTVGQYRLNVVPQIAGDWKATLTIKGPYGRAEAHFLVTVK